MHRLQLAPNNAPVRRRSRPRSTPSPRCAGPCGTRSRCRTAPAASTSPPSRWTRSSARRWTWRWTPLRAISAAKRAASGAQVASSGAAPQVWQLAAECSRCYWSWAAGPAAGSRVRSLLVQLGHGSGSWQPSSVASSGSRPRVWQPAAEFGRLYCSWATSLAAGSRVRLPLVQLGHVTSPA